MAKKSKVVANERRRETVARHADRRAALKATIRSTSSTPRRRRPRNRRSTASRATPARCGCAIATRSTDGRGGICASSACRGCGSASWHTAVSCPASGSRAGETRQAGPTRRPQEAAKPVVSVGDRARRLQGHRHAATVPVRARQDPFPSGDGGDRPAAATGLRGDQNGPRNGTAPVPRAAVIARRVHGF